MVNKHIIIGVILIIILNIFIIKNTIYGFNPPHNNNQQISNKEISNKEISNTEISNKEISNTEISDKDMIKNIKETVCPITKRDYMKISIIGALIICVLFELTNYFTNNHNINIKNYIILFFSIIIVSYYMIIYTNYIFIELSYKNINEEIIEIEKIKQ